MPRCLRGTDVLLPEPPEILSGTCQVFLSGESFEVFPGFARVVRLVPSCSQCCLFGLSGSLMVLAQSVFCSTELS